MGKGKRRSHGIEEKRKVDNQPGGYLAYLNSEHWEDTVQRFRGSACQFCFSAKGLNLHHIRYNNLGGEQREDFLTFCNDCHYVVHRRKAKKELRLKGWLWDKPTDRLAKAIYTGIESKKQYKRTGRAFRLIANKRKILGKDSPTFTKWLARLDISLTDAAKAYHQKQISRRDRWYKE